MEDWQNACKSIEGKNATLSRQLGDQESCVEQPKAELANQKKRAKELARKDNKLSRAIKWGDSVQDLLSGGGTFHTNSAIDSVFARAGAPLSDTITNSQYQGNVGML